MRLLLLLTFVFNLHAIDTSYKSCLDVFKHQLKIREAPRSFPYSFSKALKFSPNQELRQIDQIKELRLGTYNLENFAASSSKLNSDQIVDKTYSIMKAIENSNLDIVVLQEVLEPSFLKTAVKEILQDKYRVMLIDLSGVYDKIGFLVKKDLPLKFKLHSLNEFKTSGRRTFNKDFPVLEIIKDEEPVMFFGGLHLKSKFGGSEGNDYYSKVRQIQLKGILDIQENISKKYSNAPFIIAGDFNNNLTEPVKEFESLKRYMSDAFDLSAKAPQSRLTNITNYKGQRITSQLDGFFVNNSSLDKISINSTEVYQSTNAKGFKVRLDDPRASRDQFASDHSMVITSIDFQKLIDRK